MAVNLQQSILSEIADFWVSQPTLEQIIAYRVSDAVQAYLDDMLEKNREVGLSPDERLELEKILSVVDMMNLAKAKARLELADKA